MIRVNSQSGKGGVAWVLEERAGIRLDRERLLKLSGEVQRRAEQCGTELSAQEILELVEAG